MIMSPMDVLSSHPVRKTKAQKENFRTDVMEFFRRHEYVVSLEQYKSGGPINIVAGNPEQAKYLITAHYDTPPWMFLPNLVTPCSLPLFILWQTFLVLVLIGLAAIPAVAVGLLLKDAFVGYLVWYVFYMAIFLMLRFGPANKHNANDNTSGVVTVLEIAKSMPQHLRDKVCFVLFDLEEAGLKGSAAYRKAHKETTEKQIVLNLDCVGDGDEIFFMPNKKLRQEGATCGCNADATISCLRKAEGMFGNKRITVRMEGFSKLNSDHKKFPLGVGVAAFRRGKLALYVDRIHTHRDTILEQTNVNLLRAAIITVVGSAVQ